MAGGGAPQTGVVAHDLGVRRDRIGRGGIVAEVAVAASCEVRHGELLAPIGVHDRLVPGGQGIVRVTPALACVVREAERVRADGRVSYVEHRPLGNHVVLGIEGVVLVEVAIDPACHTGEALGRAAPIGTLVEGRHLVRSIGKRANPDRSQVLNARLHWSKGGEYEENQCR